MCDSGNPTRPDSPPGWRPTRSTRGKLARRLFHSVFRQVFEDNLFHADMHPGNIILLRNSRFSVLDARNVGSLESENLAKHRMFFEALADQNYSVAADLYLFLASSLPVVEVAAVKSQLVRAFRPGKPGRTFASLPLCEKSISRLFHDLNNITFRSGFQIAVVHVPARADLGQSRRLARVPVARHELPDADAKILSPREAARRSQNPRNAATHLVRNLSDAARLPKTLAENEIFRQTIVRRQVRVFQGSTSKVACVLVGVVFIAVVRALLLALFLLTAFVHQHFDVPTRLLLDGQWAGAARGCPKSTTWFGLLILLAAAYLFLVARRWTRYFRRKEVRVPEVRAAV